MSLIAHRLVTLLLLLAALGLWAIAQQTSRAGSPESVAVGNIWEILHRGYPSQFGYLSHHWGLRLIETETEAEVRSEDLTLAMKLKLFDDKGLFGSLTIQFDSKWFMVDSDLVKFDIDKRTARVMHYSEGFDIKAFEPYLLDLLHEMFNSPRQIIMFTDQEILVDVPYMGIVRAKQISEASLITENMAAKNSVD